MSRYGWKEKIAWPFIWIAGLMGPAIKRLQDRVSRWLGW